MPMIFGFNFGHRKRNKNSASSQITIGFLEEDLKKCYVPLSQLPGESTKRSGGTAWRFQMWPGTGVAEIYWNGWMFGTNINKISIKRRFDRIAPGNHHGKVTGDPKMRTDWLQHWNQTADFKSELSLSFDGFSWISSLWTSTSCLCTECRESRSSSRQTPRDF